MLVSSYLTFSPLPKRKRFGGIFSVALSVELLPLGVTQHPALWSSDFPRDETPRGHPNDFENAAYLHQTSLLLGW